MPTNAPPHVYAGVACILTLSRANLATANGSSNLSKRLRRSQTTLSNTAPTSTIEDDKIPALIASIVFYVLRALSGKNTTPKEYDSLRDRTVEAIFAFCDTRQLPISNTTALELARDIDQFIAQAHRSRWLEEEWFSNIPAESGIDNEDDDEGTNMQDAVNNDDMDVVPQEAAEQSDAMLSAGLGTMMQPRVDWLSPARVAHFQRWKKDILARCDRIEELKEKGDGCPGQHDAPCHYPIGADKTII